MLTHTPFAGLDIALYGRSFDELRARRDQRESEERNARLAAAKRCAEVVTFNVSDTMRSVYPFLAAGQRSMPRRSIMVHRDNIRDILTARPLSLGERNAVRAMLRKLDAIAA